MVRLNVDDDDKVVGEDYGLITLCLCLISMFMVASLLLGIGMITGNWTDAILVSVIVTAYLAYVIYRDWEQNR